MTSIKAELIDCAGDVVATLALTSCLDGYRWKDENYDIPAGNGIYDIQKAKNQLAYVCQCMGWLVNFVEN